MTRLEELSRDRCIEILERHVVGRVAFSTSMGPRIVPVNYTVSGDAVIIRTTPFSELGTYGRDAEVALEVDEIDTESRASCSTVIRGRSHVIDEAEVRVMTPTTGPAEWLDRQHDLYLRIPLRDVTGRRLCPGTTSAA